MASGSHDQDVDEVISTVTQSLENANVSGSSTNIFIENLHIHGSSSARQRPVRRHTFIGSDWTLSHSLTVDELRIELRDNQTQRYRLVNLCGYCDNGSERYLTLWEKGSGPEWTAMHGLSKEEYMAALDDLKLKGFYVIKVSGYVVNKVTKFAAIWEKHSVPIALPRHRPPRLNPLVPLLLPIPGLFALAFNQMDRAIEVRDSQGIVEETTPPNIISKVNMTDEIFSEAYDNYNSVRYQLQSFNAYVLDNTPKFAAVWGNPPTFNDYHATWNQTEVSISSLHGRKSEEGFQLNEIHGYTVSGNVRYAALFEKSRTSGREIIVWGYSLDKFVHELDKIVAQKFKIKFVHAFASGSGILYSMKYEK